MKSIVLAEKPSVGREIARVLNCKKKTKSYIEGSRYIVTWALGHLVTLAEPHAYNKKYRQWRLEDLPMLPYRMKLKVIKQTSYQFKTVKHLMSRKDIRELIIATDAGREGELVARWIMVLSGWNKPFKRLWISSMTDDAIKKGFKELKPGRQYDNLYRAAVCRAEADWIIGLNISRALTCKFNAQLNAGRVQTPTLAMIVNREKEIENFKPKNYWIIKADFGDYTGDWHAINGSSQLFDFETARDIASKVESGTGVIEKIKIESKKELPPLAYDLTELQRDANKNYGFSAHKTLSILQGLYEKHKLVTYPRTDSRYITSDMVSTLKNRLQSIATGPYEKLAAPLLEKSLKSSKRFVNDSKVSDHHALIPTGEKLNLSRLETDEKKLYNLIAVRFISVLYPPCYYDKTTIVTRVNNERFYSTGKVVKNQGWKTVVDKTEKKNNENEQISNFYHKGDKKRVKNSNIIKKQTKPPSRYTEATLLTAMEYPGKFIDDEELRSSIKGSGLGTPATRAEIIEKLINTTYIERQGKSLSPTSKGKQLIDLVSAGLKSPELTAEWEKTLTNIALGKTDNVKFMKDIRKYAAELVESIKKSKAEYKADNITNNKCPICGKKMLLVNAKKRGKMLRCSDRKCGFTQNETDKDDIMFKSNKKASRYNKKLISKYSDRKNISSSLGDALKAAMEEKKDNR